VTKYNEDKKKYEDSVKARKEDSSKELAKRPDMPTPVPPAYSGLQLDVKGMQTGASPASTWATSIKAETTKYDAVLKDFATASASEPVLVKRDNTISYLPSWGGPTAPSPLTI